MRRCQTRASPDPYYLTPSFFTVISNFTIQCQALISLIPVVVCVRALPIVNVFKTPTSDVVSRILLGSSGLILLLLFPLPTHLMLVIRVQEISVSLGDIAAVDCIGVVMRFVGCRTIVI
jgi:hypothetical protein